MEELKTLPLGHENEPKKFGVVVFEMCLLEAGILDMQHTHLHEVIITVKLNDSILHQDKILLFEVSL